MIIEPLTENNGLTTDTYLSIEQYIPINNNYAIKPGIYLGTPEQIIVNVVKINQ